MTKLRQVTSYPGVYTRFSTRRKLSNGTSDICYEIIYYDVDGNIRYKKIGWASEGVTLEQAVAIRLTLAEEQKQLKIAKKKTRDRSPRQAKRIKTKYPGVYVRDSFRRKCPDGKPDKCYDIVWYIGNGKYQWEKVGWRSEGYEDIDAVRIRSERIRALRHPEFFKETSEITLDESWKYYSLRWLPSLKEAKKFESRYVQYLQPKFGSWRLIDIKTYHVDEFKIFLFSKKLSPARVKLILCDLRRIIRKVAEWELYTGPIPKFHMPKVENDRLRYFSVQETNDYLRELSLYSCEMYYIAKIEFYTGLRLNDILSLTKNDVNIEKGIIYTDGKTGRHEAYFSENLKKDLLLLLQKSKFFLFTDKKGEKYTSNYMSHKFSKYIACTNVNKGIKDRKYKFVFHSGRHTFGSLLAENGESLYIVQKAMGHDDGRSTERYAKVSPNAKRKALSRLDELLGGNGE